MAHNFVSGYAPNHLGRRFPAAGATTWFVVGQDPASPLAAPTLHATIAAMIAAGKVPWPFAAVQGDLQSISMRSDNASIADGSIFLVAFDRSDADPPTDNTADREVSGSGQTFVDVQFHNMWVRQSVTTDRIHSAVRW